MNLKKCIVKTKDGEKHGDFYGIFQHSHVKQAILVGEVGGTVAYPVAVVDWGEGLEGVFTHQIVSVKENE